MGFLCIYFAYCEAQNDEIIVCCGDEPYFCSQKSVDSLKNLIYSKGKMDEWYYLRTNVCDEYKVPKQELLDLCIYLAEVHHQKLAYLEWEVHHQKLAYLEWTIMLTNDYPYRKSKDQHSPEYHQLDSIDWNYIQAVLDILMKGANDGAASCCWELLHYYFNARLLGDVLPDSVMDIDKGMQYIPCFCETLPRPDSCYKQCERYAKKCIRLRESVCPKHQNE